MFRCAAALAALLAACGDNAGSVPLEDVALAIETARCERLTRCGLFPDAATCEARIRLPIDASLRAAVADGSVRYHPLRLDACLTALAAESCNETLADARAPSPCTGVFVGTRAPGEPCELADQCSTDRCDQVDCHPGMCCPGTCAPPRVALAGACDSDDDCVGAAQCGPDGTCAPLAEAGQPCRTDRQCVSGAGCIGAGVEPGTCRVLPLLGERCLYARCAEVNAVCTDGTCVAAGPGAPCTSNADCTEFGQCDVDAGVCVSFPVLGEPCELICGGDAYCDFTNVEGVCADLLPDETPCSSGNACASAYCQEGPFFDVCKTAAVCT